jgi:hypothetical protein
MFPTECCFCNKDIIDYNPIERRCVSPCDHRYHINCLVKHIATCHRGEWPMCVACQMPLQKKFMSNVLNTLQTVVYKQCQIVNDERRKYKVYLIKTKCKRVLANVFLMKSKTQSLRHLECYYSNVFAESSESARLIKESMSSIERARRILHIQYKYHQYD